MRRLLPPALLLAALLIPAAAHGNTTWLCRPGLAHNPCVTKLDTSVFSPTGKLRRVEHPQVAKSRPVDCFYVYPTVSDQKGTYANRHVDPVERSIALYQAARYSQVCRVYAPMYRQITLTHLLQTGQETEKELRLPYTDIRAAFRDYLAHYSHGRGFVLIGHSQGSFLLRRLVAEEIDRVPKLRVRLVSALLMGGNILVAKGKRVGGDFRNVPGCTSATQLRCVIAFSTYDQPVPQDSGFGRAKRKDREVLCTNPAALGGGSAPVDTIVPGEPFAPGGIAAGISLLHFKLPEASTTWMRFPGAFTARCSSAGGAHVLQITPAPGGQKPDPSPNAQTGLHLLDANIAFGNLVDVVRQEAHEYLIESVSE